MECRAPGLTEEACHDAWAIEFAAAVCLLRVGSRGTPSSPFRRGLVGEGLEEKIRIPTYLAGPPELNPMFYLGRQSQGAEGRIYPYPFYDTLTGNKVDKTYNMVCLENEYLRIGILPEIGGRLFEEWTRPTATTSSTASTSSSPH